MSNVRNDTPCAGLRIVKLGKTYTKLPFGIKSKRDMEALKDIYLEIEDGELLALL